MDSGFFEKVSRAHEAMDVESDGDDEEKDEGGIIMGEEAASSGINTYEHEFVKEADITDDMRFENLAPSIQSDDEDGDDSAGREEGRDQ